MIKHSFRGIWYGLCVVIVTVVLTGVATRAFASIYNFTNGYIGSNGYVGIGTTTPAYPLTVSGNANISGTLTAGAFSGPLTGTESAGNISAGTFGHNTGGGNYTFPGNVSFSVSNPDLSASSYIVIPGGAYFNGGTVYMEAALRARGGIMNDTNSYLTIAGGTSGYTYFSGNVGIGTTAPAYKLDVQGGQINSSGGYCINGANCITSWPTGSFTGSGTANYIPLFASSTALGNSAIYQSGSNVGIGTIAPAQKLEVNGSVQVDGNLSVGSNKITAGTLDPIYTIAGTNYATYLPGMTGVNEETAGTLTLTRNADGTYSDTIDFATAPTGSDFWLFAQVTNLKNEFSGLIVSLTPSFDGRVWYTKNAAADTLTIHGTAAGEVSYNLTAPRFDAAKWTNLGNPDGKGLLIQ